MNTNDITKAVTAASQLLKGAKPTVSLATVEDAMLALGDLRKRAGETSAAAFARLVAAGDSDMVTLAKAAERLRISTDNRTVRKHARQFHAEAVERLDEYVELVKRDGEDAATTTSRLAREKDGTFGRLYAHLKAASDAAQQ